jgi:hypothetical protein
MIVVDMAGNEDPYDIISKTVPTIDVKPKESEEYKTNKLIRFTSTDLTTPKACTDTDVIIETISNQIYKTMNDIFTKVNTGISNLRYYTGTGSDNMKDAYIYDVNKMQSDVKKLFSFKHMFMKYLVHEDYKKLDHSEETIPNAKPFQYFFDIDRLKKFTPLLDKYRRDFTILNYHFYSLITIAIKICIKKGNEYMIHNSPASNGFNKRYNGKVNILLDQGNNLKQFASFLQQKKQKQQNYIYKVSEIINELCNYVDSITKKRILNDMLDKFDMIYSEKEDSNVYMSLTKHQYMLLSLYYICMYLETQDLKLPTGSEYNEKPQGLLNLMTYLQNSIYSIKDTESNKMKNYILARYAVQLLLLLSRDHDIKKRSEWKSQTPKKIITFNVTFGINSEDPTQIIQNFSSLETRIGDAIGEITKDLLMEVIVVKPEKNPIACTKPVKETTEEPTSANASIVDSVHSRYDIIHGNFNYYQSIITEGFYINQVNYELIDFLYKTKQYRSGGNYEKYKTYIDAGKKEEIDITKLQNYNALNSLSRNDSDNLTQIKHVFKKIFGIQNETDIKNIENIRWFMLANIRPEYNRFRSGAQNTLELVNKLKST